MKDREKKDGVVHEGMGTCLLAQASETNDAKNIALLKLRKYNKCLFALLK